MQVFRSKVISQSLRQSSTKAAAAEVPKLSYSERMAATGRPVSPHIFIYAWPITALTSITNRVTGGVLTIGCAGMGAVSLFGGDAATMMTCIGTSAVGPLMKMAVGFPFVYHYVSGIRHLVWDASPESLTNAGVQSSSFAVAGIAAAITLGLGFTTLDALPVEEANH